MNQLVMPNTRDCDEELAGVTYIRELFPCSDNPEWSVLNCNFRRAFFEFVLDLAAEPV